MCDRLEHAELSRTVVTCSVAAVVGVYLLVTFVASYRRLWHDELFTFYIATAPSWSRLWKEIALDLNPPLEYVLVRLSTSLFGWSNYAVRLPSIAGFLAGSLCLWVFVARRLSACYGLLAVSVFWASPFFYYASEARPYALVTCFLGLTLIAWERATRLGRHWSTVACLGFSVSAMMLSHLMSPLYVAPFCLAELARWWRTRRIDLAVWSALLLPCAIPFVYLRLMARFGESVFPAAFQASLTKVPEAYYGTLRLEALPLLVGLGAAALTGSAVRGVARPKLSVSPDPVTVALIAGFLLVPLMVNLALMRSHGAYFERYALPVEFGYALAVAFALYRVVERTRAPALIASGVLLAFMLAYNLGPGLKHSVWAGTSDRSDAVLASLRPDLPLVAASGLTFIELSQYGNSALVRRLYYLTDHDKAVRYAHATIFEGMPDLKTYFPIRARVEPYARFVSEHPAFLVLGTPDYPEDWLLAALLDGRATVRYLGRVEGPYKDHQLYLASLVAH